MRTTLILNDVLIQEIRRYSGLGSKTEIIHRALEEMLSRLKRERIKQAAGKMVIELDVGKFRDRDASI